MDSKSLLLDKNYFQLKALSKSQILQYIRSPVLFWRTTPFNPNAKNWQETDATAFGSLLHLLLLEPENFKLRHSIYDFGATRRNKKYAEKLEEMEARDDHRTVISPREAERAMTMIKAIERNKKCQKNLNGAKTESPIVWTDDKPRLGESDMFMQTGRKFKGKMDGIQSDKAGRIRVIDYKSTAMFDKVSKDPIKNGFQIQCAMYNEGVRARYGVDIHEFIFIVQSSIPGEEDLISIERLGPATFQCGQRELFYNINKIDKMLSRVENGERPEEVFIHQEEEIITVEASTRYLKFWEGFSEYLSENPDATVEQYEEKLRFRRK